MVIEISPSSPQSPVPNPQSPIPSPHYPLSPEGAPSSPIPISSCYSPFPYVLGIVGRTGL
ncbi:phosphoribosylaminoimidazole carboxylase ATPase subunit [Tolypothrix sp. PCC 7601]|nr:phosphoribosylaminoimidazole carboxylase ATPase subunit [Tolypothrix sp. PCC 7601]